MGGFVFFAFAFYHQYTIAVNTYIEFYYPFANLSVGFVFRGGALMRPWLGLMVFGLLDLLYAWAEKNRNVRVLL